MSAKYQAIVLTTSNNNNNNNNKLYSSKMLQNVTKGYKMLQDCTIYIKKAYMYKSKYNRKIQ